jgi:hypothetical protein
MNENDVDSAALAELERVAAERDAARPNPVIARTVPDVARAQVDADIAAELHARAQPAPSRLVPIVTITGPQGQLLSAIDLGPLDARNERIEQKLNYVTALVMSLADIARVTSEEQDKNEAAIRNAQQPARPGTPGGGR